MNCTHADNPFRYKNRITCDIDGRTMWKDETCDRFKYADECFEQSQQEETKLDKLAENVLREYVKFKDVNGSKTVNLLPLTIVDAMVEFADRLNEQPEAIAGENDITSLVDESFKGLAELIHDNDLFEFYKQLIITLYENYTAFKDQKITELTNLLSDTNKRIQEIQDEEELKDKQLQVQQSHIDDQDQLIFDQDKEIKELKAEVERLRKRPIVYGDPNQQSK